MFPLQARLWSIGWVEVQFYPFMTTALEVGEWSAARPGRTLPPGKTRYPLYRRLGGPQGRSGRAENLASPGFDPRTVQPVAQSLYRLSYPAHNKPVNALWISQTINTVCGYKTEFGLLNELVRLLGLLLCCGKFKTKNLIMQRFYVIILGL